MADNRGRLNHLQCIYVMEGYTVVTVSIEFNDKGILSEKVYKVLHTG